VAIDRNVDTYVRTEDLEEAFDILEDKGHVVLCGCPGSGKTTVAHALLRRCREEGFQPCVFTDIKDWQGHVAEGKKTVVLMDGTLGEVRQ
jgi:DNA replication protein DnaC